MANSRPRFILIPGRTSSAARRLRDNYPYDNTSGVTRGDSPHDTPGHTRHSQHSDADSEQDDGDQRRRRKIDAFMRAISRVLTPVIICMALAIWLVHSLADPRLCRPLRKGRVFEPPDSLESEETGSISDDESSPTNVFAGSSDSFVPAIIFIAIFLVLIVLFTFLLVYLYKAGKAKYIMGWLILAVVLIFAYVGGLYIFDFCRSRCIPLDWVTLSVAVWNFTITGLISVFGMAPRLVNQGYLIVMSALMAYIFRTLPSWSVWVVLGLLVAWDLFAVLSPYGPLNRLVALARERNDTLPALVYDTNPDSVLRNEGAPPAIRRHRRQKKQQISCLRNDALNTTDTGEGNMMTQGSASEVMRRVGDDVEQVGDTDTDESDFEHVPDSTMEYEEEDDEEIQVGTLGAHLKLGLGDFVFYSILVTQASQEGAMTTVASIMAILAGLSVTLILVTAYRRALPALPISICAGLIFHFLTRFTLQPLLRELGPDMIFF